MAVTRRQPVDLAPDGDDGTAVSIRAAGLPANRRDAFPGDDWHHE
jgi:hypothetical protein